MSFLNIYILGVFAAFGYLFIEYHYTPSYLKLPWQNAITLFIIGTLGSWLSVLAIVINSFIDKK